MSEAEAFLNKLVEAARAVAFCAGEGEMETAGLMVSILHNNPDWIARFMSEGTELFVDVGFSAEIGSLNYRAMNGKITTPQQLFEKLRQTKEPTP